MTAPALQLELPDADTPSVWPWVVLVLAGCALVYLLLAQLVAIPESLERQSLSAIRASGADGVTVDVNGRDLTLGGELDINADRVGLIARVRQIEGVRIVRDGIVVVDPAARAAADREVFAASIADVDLSRVAFEPGSVALAAGSDAALDEVAAIMKDRPDQRIRVAGHTDSRGRAEVNLALSRERAVAVANDLASRGVDRRRIIALGYGATQPIADNETESGRARNRRIEIVDID